MCKHCKNALSKGMVLLAEKSVYFGVFGDALLETFMENKSNGKTIISANLIPRGYGEDYAETIVEINYCPFCGAKLDGLFGSKEEAD